MVKTEFRPNVIRILSSLLFLWFLLFPNYSLFGQTACNPPESVSISNEGETLIVEWEALETAGYYQIIIDDATGIVVAFENIDLPFFITNLPYGEYFISIQSVCGEVFSVPYQVPYILGLSDCDMPENVEISNEEETLIVEWSPVETASYYEISIIDATGIAVIETTTDESIFFTDLPNGSYLINIQTVCDEGLVSDVYVTDYVLDEPTCATPQNMDISNEGETLTVEWEAVEETAFYQIIILNEMGELVLSEFTNESVFSTELSNTVYTVYIYQICEGDEGLELSDPYQETYFMSSTECAAPENVAATSVGEDVTVTWSPVEGVDSYWVTIINEEGAIMQSEPIDETIYEVSLPDGEYTINVQAICIIGGIPTPSDPISTSINVINAMTVAIDPNNRIGIPIDTSTWGSNCFMVGNTLDLWIGGRGTIQVPIVQNVSSNIPLSSYQHRVGVATNRGELVIKKPRLVRNPSLELIMEVDVRGLTWPHLQMYDCDTINWLCADMELWCDNQNIYKESIALVQADISCVAMTNTIVLKCGAPITVSNINRTWSPVRPLGEGSISNDGFSPVNISGGKAVGNGKTTTAPNPYQNLVLHITPNPTTTGFHLNLNCPQEEAQEPESGKINFTLYTLNGQLLRQETYDYTCSSNTYINIADLPNGMYLAQVQTEEGVKFTERVVKY